MGAVSIALTPYTTGYTIMESLASAIADDRANEVDYHGSTQHLLSLFRGVGVLIQTGTPIQHNTIYSSTGDANSVLLYPQAAPHSTAQQRPQILPDHTRALVHLPFTRTSPHPRGVSDRPRSHLPTPSLSGGLCQRDHQAFSLAATIPPEIIDIIASYLADCVGTDPWDPNLVLVRTENSNGIEDSYQPLKSCSLVCRRWANICRYSLFLEATLEFSSSEIWEEFLVYSSRGCPSLVPIYKLISEIHFIQRYQSTMPAFCYRIRDVPRGMLDHIYLRLDLLGPVPRTFPPGMLSTPHWSIPPTLTTPHSLLHPFYTISVTNVHMPSLLHVLKFIRYVAYTSSVFDPHSKVDTEHHDPVERDLEDGLHLHKLTWDSGKRQHYPFCFRRPNLSQLRPYDPQAFAHFFCAAEECTSNICLCTYAAIAHPGCWMHWLLKAEQEWILALMEFLQDSFVDVTHSQCYVGMPIDNDYPEWRHNSGIRTMKYRMLIKNERHQDSTLEHGPYSPYLTLTLHFEALPRGATSKTSVRILGLQLELDWQDPDIASHFNLDILIQQLRKISPGRLSGDKIVILVSASYREILQASMKRYRPIILNPQTEEYDYVFTYNYDYDFRYIAVNPVTAIPTGQSWKKSDDIIPSLCKVPLHPEAKDV